MKKTLLMALLAAWSIAPAQTDHSGHRMGTMPGVASGAAGESTYSDRAFLSGMIEHHRGALGMARKALPTLKSVAVKAWAQAIVSAQTREIGQMTAWLGGLGGTDARAAGAMKQDMADMLASMKAANMNRAFLEAMMPHHASAVRMALGALEHSRDARVLGLARAIVRQQGEEMYQFRAWLLKNGA